MTVPSMGSTVQLLPAGNSRSGLSSSPTTQSPPNSLSIAEEMNFSIAKSTSVTRSKVPLARVCRSAPPQAFHASLTILLRNASSFFPSFIAYPLQNACLTRDFDASNPVIGVLALWLCRLRTTVLCGRRPSSADLPPPPSRNCSYFEGYTFRTATGERALSRFRP